MKKLLFSLLMLTSLSAACQPKNDVDHSNGGDCEPPKYMDLPGGYEIHYDMFDITDPANEEVMYDDVDFYCFLDKHVAGGSVDYCGFTVQVYDDYFSFDSVPSSYDGDDVDGIGTKDGATITIVTAAGNIYEYRIEHVLEF